MGAKDLSSDPHASKHYPLSHLSSPYRLPFPRLVIAFQLLILRFSTLPVVCRVTLTLFFIRMCRALQPLVFPASPMLPLCLCCLQCGPHPFPFSLSRWTVSPHCPVVLATLNTLFRKDTHALPWLGQCPALTLTWPWGWPISFLVFHSPFPTVLISGAGGFYVFHKYTSDLILMEAEFQSEYFLFPAGRGWLQIKEFQVCQRLQSFRALCGFHIRSHLCLLC